MMNGKTANDTLIALDPRFEWDGLTFGIAKIGPELAKLMLSTYEVDYRRHMERHSDGLAEDMQALAWIFEGSPIKLTKDGKLIDGQHRLNAVVKSGEAQNFLVITGFSDEVYDVTDTGKSRRYADLLRRREYQNADAVTALIKLVYRWQSGSSMEDTRKLTNHKMDEVLDANKDLILRAIQLGASTKRIPIPFSVVSFCWWIFMGIDVEDAHRFMNDLANGENIKAGMPVYTLRERLNTDKDMVYTRSEYLFIIFQAWNKFRDDEEIRTLTLGQKDITRTRLNTRAPR